VLPCAQLNRHQTGTSRSGAYWTAWNRWPSGNDAPVHASPLASLTVRRVPVDPPSSQPACPIAGSIPRSAHARLTHAPSRRCRISNRRPFGRPTRHPAFPRTRQKWLLGYERTPVQRPARLARQQLLDPDHPTNASERNPPASEMTTPRWAGCLSTVRHHVPASSSPGYLFLMAFRLEPVDERQGKVDSGYARSGPRR
jgi:hypothetical protein